MNVALLINAGLISYHPYLSNIGICFEALEFETLTQIVYRYIIEITQTDKNCFMNLLLNIYEANVICYCGDKCHLFINIRKTNS